MTSPRDLIALAEVRTVSLLDEVGRLDDAAMREPSRLPGWSRGHVLTHLARNASALCNLLTWATTGVETPMYPSREVRNADIEAGSGRPAREILDDLAATSTAWADTARSVPEEAWAAVTRQGAHNVERQASWIPVMRLTEIELHRVDLGTGYALDAAPAQWVGLALADASSGVSERAGEPLRLHASDTGDDFGDPAGRTITGAGAALLAWLTGRSDGSTLDAGRPLPRLGDWL